MRPITALKIPPAMIHMAHFTASVMKDSLVMGKHAQMLMNACMIPIPVL